MWHDLWDADHRPVSSVNLSGSPARTGRICAESYPLLPGDEGRPSRTAGDDHHAINCRFDVAAKPADTVETCASWIMANFSWRSLERSSLDESSSINDATIESAKEA